MNKPTLQDLLDANPDADRELLEEALRIAEKLRESGFSGARYRLATPISRAENRERRTPNQRGSHADHRLVRRF